MSTEHLTDEPVSDDPSTEPAATDPRPGAIAMSMPVGTLPHVSAARARSLAKLGLRNARDVLFFFPRSHEFPPPPTRVADLSEGRPAALTGRITEAELVSRRPGKSLFGALVENESGTVRLLFFNQPFRAEQMTLDRLVRIEGAPKLAGLRWEFTHPKVTFLEEAEAAEDSGAIQPIYPLTEGVKQYELRRLTRRVTESLGDHLTEVLPESLRKLAAERLNEAGLFDGASLPAIGQTLRGIHLPASAEELAAAQMRLVFQELLVMQLALAMRRRALTSGLRAPPLTCSPLIRNRILRRFPFELTDDQKRVMRTIATEMGRQFPMNRLLQGDVGSGKTAVAIFAMLLAVAGGHQATLMAPTEVLARQHYATLTALLKDSRVRVGLLSGSLGAAQRRETIAAAASGDLDLIVGTQALLHDVRFASLALCVIDEQHKFGVGQRVKLRDGGIDPHYLVMSATPIPRSVAMTQFGDVDLSTLREKPAQRGTIHTYLADDQWKDRWWSFVRERIAEGRQAYVVAPRVGDAETVEPDDFPEEPSSGKRLEPADVETTDDVTSVTQTFHELTTGPLKGLQVALLHGRMPAEQKQQVMDRFAQGEIDVLVTTTVIEVGIDVANATVMTILGGNRFGLAQMHQLRGRVCRSTHAGHVCVFTDGDRSPREDERLQVFESTSDGFEIAEADFRLRGPGDLLGRRQSGLPPLRIADLNRDVPVLEIARELAQDLIDADPDMEATELADLKSQVLRRYGDRLTLSDGA